MDGTKRFRPVFFPRRPIPQSPKPISRFSKMVKILAACFAADLLVSACILGTLGVRSTIDCFESVPSSVVASYLNPAIAQAAAVQLVRVCIGKDSLSGGEN
jgi:hypothetical protein